MEIDDVRAALNDCWCKGGFCDQFGCASVRPLLDRIDSLELENSLLKATHNLGQPKEMETRP
jgi:hypothetical protein